MLVAFLAGSLAMCTPPVRPALHAPPVSRSIDSTLAATFEKGVTFARFLESATARREGWLRLAREAVIAPEVIARARAVGGSWRLLVIARDACGDSMNSVPYAARLAESVPNLALRVVAPGDAEPVSRAHRTMDGRTATPTFVLLDAQGREAGCVVELPAPLRQWTDTARATVGSDSLHAYRDAFYAKDRGASISRELVEVLEAAKAGAPRCDRQPPR